MDFKTEVDTTMPTLLIVFAALISLGIITLLYKTVSTWSKKFRATQAEESKDLEKLGTSEFDETEKKIKDKSIEEGFDIEKSKGEREIVRKLEQAELLTNAQTHLKGGSDMQITNEDGVNVAIDIK